MNSDQETEASPTDRGAAHVQSRSEAQLQWRREAVRRGLLRANTAGFLLLCVVVGLALVALVQGRRADQQRARAEAALWEAGLAQARAERASVAGGRRANALRAIATAARIRPSLEARNEAVAALALTDLEEETWQPFPPGVSSIAFDAAMERFLLADAQGGIRLLRTRNQSEVLRLPGGPAEVQWSCFDQAGRYLAVRYHGGHVWLWDLARKEAGLTLKVEPNGPAAALDFDREGRNLAVANVGGALRLYDVSSGTEVAQRKVGVVEALDFHPTEQVLAYAVSNKISVWNLDTGQCREEATALPWVSTLAWHPDGVRLAGGSPFEESFTIWNLNTRQHRDFHGHGPNYLIFNHRGDLLMTTGHDGTARLWDVFSGRVQLITHWGYPFHFSPDDARVCYHRPKEGGGVWRMAHREVFQAVPVAESEERNVWSVDFSPDGRWLLAGKLDGIWLYETETGRRLAHSVGIQAKSAWFDAGGQSVIASGTEGITRWAVSAAAGPAGQPVPVLGPPQREPLDAELGAQKSQPDPLRRSLAAVAGPDAAMVWRVTGQPAPILFRDPGYRSLAYAAVSPDGRWLATGTWHGKGSRVWDVRTRQPARDLGGRSATVGFSPDGRWLLLAASDKYQFVETGSWRLGPSVPRDALGELTGYADFSPDGKMVAIAKSHRLVQLISLETFAEVASLTAPDPQVITCVRFSREGRWLAAGTASAVMQVWDLRQVRAELARLGLDWPPTAPTTASSTPLAAPGNGMKRTGMTVALVVGGLAVALASGVVVFRWRRRLIRSYAEVEAMVIQHGRALETAQAQLVHSERMKALGTLAAGIAHDFNNLLSVIRMANKLVDRETKTNPELQENVAAIEHAVQEGRTIVRSMLGYSRAATEEPAQYSVPELVEDMIGLLGRQFLSGIVLTLEFDRDLPPVCGSRGRLEQILLNLVVNASEAMKGQGKLTVRVRAIAAPPAEALLRAQPGRSYVEVNVSDNGPGIAPEVLPHIFEPFFTTKTVGAARGTGLGLSMVYTLAEQEGMGLAVHTTLGAGTAFSIIVPVRDSHSSQAAAAC